MGDALSQAVALTDAGILFGDTPLARFTTSSGHIDHGAPERIVALLSVAEGRPLDPASVLPAVEAAAAHWSRGEKALANLRLAFATLPRRVDPLDRARVRAAAYLLDGGLPPNDLMKALWPAAEPVSFEKYRPDEARIPAGHGRGSGEWTFAADPFSFDERSARNDRIVVASEEKPSPAERVLYEEHKLSGRTTTQEEFAHGGIDPLDGTPLAATPAQVGKVREIIDAIADALPPGRGARYGTAFHTELKLRLRALADPDIHAEVSYLKGSEAKYGRTGSVRADIVTGILEKLKAIFDLKPARRGLAGLKSARIAVICPGWGIFRFWSCAHEPQGFSTNL